MECNIFTIIFVNMFCGDDRSAKISAGIFSYLFWITHVGFGTDMKPFYVIFVDSGFMI